MSSESASKECFVIGPIGEAGSPTRRQADLLFKHVITPSLVALGYTITRADLLDEPGMITSQIVQHVIEAPLVVADLSDHNPNVFYELAIRHAIKKPLIQLIRHDQRIPFDVSITRTIKFDLTDLDSVAETREAIAKQAKRLVEKPDDFDTPISLAVDIKNLQQSEVPVEKILADLVVAVNELKHQAEPQERVATTVRRNRQTSKYSEDFVEELKRRIPISKVAGRYSQLTKAGKEWKGLSPFVEEKSPSFFVNDHKGFFHCFTTGIHGDQIDLTRLLNHMTRDEAIRMLAIEAGLETPPPSDVLS